MSESSGGLRPRDFALLLLATGDSAPRRRARDQQADRAGLDLKRRVLEEVIALDPEPGELQSSLLAMVEKFGAPFGPTRAIVSMVMQEWTLALTAPQWLVQLLDANAQPQNRGEIRVGRQLPG